ncbi:helix-turn-helix transcriptional regulator [Romeria aff. gracilis LEGE 07310]|uniref:Helix-turn-helix transcriptional regulator n=1 Tax=Vasconcelosia minhoensis LEGE 07310 TaxID=915328 RepID=A0A8J7A8K8_9CYAN|nr:helix-turn-helix transcriptional regulator [Romeria aff. gracilis LEGE 07310]
MGRAGKALKNVLQQYGISQNRLAVTMGVARSTVNQWVNEVSDPLADSIPEVINALEVLEPTAAHNFLQLYLERQRNIGAEPISR